MVAVAAVLALGRHPREVRPRLRPAVDGHPGRPSAARRAGRLGTARLRPRPCGAYPAGPGPRRPDPRAAASQHRAGLVRDRPRPRWSSARWTSCRATWCRTANPPSALTGVLEPGRGGAPRAPAGRGVGADAPTRSGPWPWPGWTAAVTGVSMRLPAGGWWLASPNGRGDVLLSGVGEIYDVWPGGSRQIGGMLAAVGPTRWLTVTCDRPHRCADVVINPADRRAAAAGRPAGRVGVGRVSRGHRAGRQPRPRCSGSRRAARSRCTWSAWPPGRTSGSRSRSARTRWPAGTAGLVPGQPVAVRRSPRTAGWPR